MLAVHFDHTKIDATVGDVKPIKTVLEAFAGSSQQLDTPTNYVSDNGLSGKLLVRADGLTGISWKSIDAQERRVRIEFNSDRLTEDSHKMLPAVLQLFDDRELSNLEIAWDVTYPVLDSGLVKVPYCRKFDRHHVDGVTESRGYGQDKTSRTAKKSPRYLFIYDKSKEHKDFTRQRYKLDEGVQRIELRFSKKGCRELLGGDFEPLSYHGDIAINMLPDKPRKRERINSPKSYQITGYERFLVDTWRNSRESFDEDPATKKRAESLVNHLVAVDVAPVLQGVWMQQKSRLLEEVNGWVA